MIQSYFLIYIRRITLLIFSLVAITSIQLQAEELPMKVAVIEFDSKGNFDIPYAGSIVAEWMISELGKIESFTLVERVLLKKVIAEQQLSDTGLLDEEKSSAELGKIYGVDAIITGSVLKWQQSITITARLIDTSSGSILRTSSVTARHISKVPQLIRKLALDISGGQSQENTSPSTNKSAQAMISSPAMRLAVEPAGQSSSTKSTTRAWLEEITGIHFIWIKPGCFVMGQSRQMSPDEQKNTPLYYPDENPAHRVCLDGFWLAQTETSNGQFRALQPGHDSGEHLSYDLNHDSQPAVMVSWQEARAFATSLTAQYENMGATFRLPSEAEWEYAARATSSTSFAWPADEICRRANGYDRKAAETLQVEKITPLSCDDGAPVSAPVASYLANSFELYDMTGNVWEWVEDVYNPDAYLNHDRDNPLYLGMGTNRVNRGGSWQDGLSRLRISSRGQQIPEQGSKNIGFRLVMERK